MQNKQKIKDMLAMPDFEYLLIETENSVNHIQKVAGNHTQGSYCWIIETRKSKTPRMFYSAESLINELYICLESRNESIVKISTLLINFRK